ncbi:jg16410 [Pararge aegeria aegeria]|uniref:Jg16410 protein n=1 Tax=Pararge aegeria aegeria TaxID=348720 RepID=A0A8S4SD14_9NEOP|nr:jg16410 [Pararge aegeria aegeria]
MWPVPTCEVSRSTAQYVKKRYLETGGYIRRTGSGLRRKTTVRDDRFIVSTSLRNRHRSAVEGQHMLRDVRNVNQGYNLHVSTEIGHWNNEDRYSFLMSRECVFMELMVVKESTAAVENGTYAQCAISERVSFGGGLRVGAFLLDSEGSVTASSYITDILSDHVVPYQELIDNNFI